MIEEATHRLDRRPSVPTELRRGVPEDVEPGRRKPSRPQVPPEPAVERHSFFDRRHQEFAAEADQAWRRTIAFLGRTLAASPAD